LTPAPSEAGMPRSTWVTARGAAFSGLIMGHRTWGPIPV
jgi:hypothetical protein